MSHKTLKEAQSKNKPITTVIDVKNKMVYFLT